MSGAERYDLCRVLGFSDAMVTAAGKKSPISDWKQFQDRHLTQAERGSQRALAEVTDDAGYYSLMGGPHEMVCFDVDDEAGGALLIETIGQEVLDRTAHETTPRGEHFYFRVPADDRTPNAAHLGGTGLDFRGYGGGVKHAPSAGYEMQRSPADGLKPMPVAARTLLAGSKVTAQMAPTAEGGLTALLAAPPPEGGRNDWLARVAGHYARQFASRDAYVEKLASANDRLDSPLPEAEVRKTADSIWKAEQVAERQGFRPLPGALTDTGNAELFAHQHVQAARHVKGVGWYVYDDELGRYERDHHKAVLLEIQTARSLFADAACCADEEVGKALAHWARLSLSGRSIEAALRLAESMPTLRARRADFDRGEMLLNVRNGVVDLATGELLPHSPRYMMTRVAGTSYEPCASCDRWLAHLERIFAGDGATIAFVQRLFGYALTGSSREQKLPIFFGAGANGKSVTLISVGDVMGEYAETADFKTFSVTRSDGPRNDLAKLAGARFVSASETNSGQWLDEAVIKQVSGGDPLTARFLYKEFFTYRPQFTVFLSTNHLPNVEGIDRALWRRILLVPFTVTIAEPDQDRDLLNKLRAELPGILGWMVRGCLDWQSTGLEPPISVQMATAEYHNETDIIGQFIEESLVAVADAWVELRDVYDIYKFWCERNGYRQMTAQQLSNRLREHGLTLTKDAPRTHRSRLRGHILVDSKAGRAASQLC